jgi:hypothetical protein
MMGSMDDAACGPGLYAAELARRGAQVVGFDHSPPHGGDRPGPGTGRRVPGADNRGDLDQGLADAILASLLETTCEDIFAAGSLSSGYSKRGWCLKLLQSNAKNTNGSPAGPWDSLHSGFARATK